MQTIKLGSRGEDVKTLQRALNLYPDGIFGPLTDEAVRELQRSSHLVEDGIVGPLTWAVVPKGINAQGATPPVELPNLKKSRRSINKIIVHCTATKEGRETTIAEIRKWHLARGFSDIGYHYVIYLDGTLHLGRDVDIAGAHTSGYNSRTIGVCYVGGLDKNGKAKDTRNPYQKDALSLLLIRLHQLYPNATIHGHFEFANKACPCFDPKTEYKSILKR